MSTPIRCRLVCGKAEAEGTLYLTREAGAAKEIDTSGLDGASRVQGLATPPEGVFRPDNIADIADADEEDWRSAIVVIKGQNPIPVELVDVKDESAVLKLRPRRSRS